MKDETFDKLWLNSPDFFTSGDRLVARYFATAGYIAAQQEHLDQLSALTTQTKENKTTQETETQTSNERPT